MGRNRSRRWRVPWVLAAFFFAPGVAAAANITWKAGGGGTGNWNTATNWVGGVVPGASDTAIFNGTGTQKCAINVNINIVGISVNAGYTGTITQANGVTVTLGASGLVLSTSTFNAGNSGISISGPLWAMTVREITSGGLGIRQ